MRKKQSLRIAVILLLLLPAGFTACIKDKCTKTHTYTYFKPIYHTKEQVRSNIKSNPAKELDRTGKFYVYGNYIFLNEIDKGVHIIDNSNPASPQNIAFIDVPGNVDLAVKGNMLYADMYTDLVAIDISNPADVKVKKIVDYVFPERNYGGGFVGTGGGNVIVDWERVDTTITTTCDDRESAWPQTGRGGDIILFESCVTCMTAGAASAVPTGISGSMARFTIVNDYMYAVDRHQLRSISISNPADPVKVNEINAGWDIETIYPFKNTLFVGSMGGMFIFDISNPASPVQQSSFVHARACDPVIADDNYAYITLRAGTTCGASNNELQIVNVENLQSPTLVKTYPMTGPQGLSKDGDILFICDGTDGLKVYNAANVNNVQLLQKISGIHTYDVIAYNKRAMVVGDDGLYQYDYTDINNIRLLSKITVTKK